jgi:dolichyl-phosphate beta-glucosyltransferase
MDADNKTSIDQIEKMWPEFEKGYEVIIGSRKIKGSKIIIPQPLLRKKQSAIFNLLVKIILNLWGIRDTQCGFKGFTKKAAENIFPKCKIDRFAFDVEILVITKKMGFKIKEIPVSWVCVPGTTVKLKNMIKMGLDLLKIKWNLITGKYQ